MVTRPTRAIRIALAVGCLTLACSIVPAAIAGKGGGASGGGTTSSAWVSASPNPVSAWTQYTITGCGFSTATQVNLVIDEPGTRAFFAARLDSSGCIYLLMTAANSGSYHIQAYQGLSGHKQTLVASTYLTVT